MKIEIKRWWDAKVIFTAEVPDDTDERFRVKVAVELAVKSGASLVGASLAGARLDGASLDGARLADASLDGARLYGASLVRASLYGASLADASLDGARLDGASLAGASLDGNSLAGATGVDWTGIRDDYWAVLSAAPREVAGLRAALAEGRVDGSTYRGSCACLVGTIANVRGDNYEQLGILKPNSERPAERFFLGIKRGDTPETNPLSKLALEWTDTWLANMRDAFTPAATKAA